MANILQLAFCFKESFIDIVHQPLYVQLKQLQKGSAVSGGGSEKGEPVPLEHVDALIGLEKSAAQILIRHRFKVSSDVLVNLHKVIELARNDDDAADVLMDHTRRIRNLLGYDLKRIVIRSACPECQAVKDEDGRYVLSVPGAIDGPVVCSACRMEWGQDRYWILAAMLQQQTDSGVEPTGVDNDQKLLVA